MRSGNASLVPALALAFLASGGPGFGQALPGPADRILERADAALAVAGSAYDLELRVELGGGRSLRYRLRNHVRDSSAQRAIFVEPEFDRGDSAIRRGDTAYFKNAAWPKYAAMNARSSFMDSPFSWEDALSPGLAGSYAIAALRWEASGGERLLRCELKPLRAGAYRRIELWLRPESYLTVRRVYYTPSGREWKTASYAYSEAGSAAGWSVTMTDATTLARAAIFVGPRLPEALPDSFFEPKDRGKGGTN